MALSAQRRYAAGALIGMLVQLLGEIVGVWLPRVGFAITIIATLLFLYADWRLLQTRENV